MDSWTESSWLNSENGAVFFTDPDHGATAEPVIFAQLTVPAGTQLHLQGFELAATTPLTTALTLVVN